MKNTHNFTTFAVLVLLVFNASLFITCEAASFPAGLVRILKLSKKGFDYVEKGIDVGSKIFDHYNDNHPSNNAVIEQMLSYCRINLAIANDPKSLWGNRKAANFLFKNYCTN